MFLFLGSIKLALGYDFREANVYLCKIYTFTRWSFSLTASSHVAGLAIDRCLMVTRPIWHRAKLWSQLVPKASFVLTVFHFLLCAPHLYFNDLSQGTCEMVSDLHFILKIYQILNPAVAGMLNMSE